MVEFQTALIHTDSAISTKRRSENEVSPAIHVSTTFKYSDEWNNSAAEKLGILPESDSLSSSGTFVGHIYSRQSNDNIDRLEAILGSLEESDDGQRAHAVAYSSGLSAILAVFSYFRPNRIFISKGGYHGTKAAMELHIRGRNTTVVHLEDIAETTRFVKGDLVWLESPRNPCGEIDDIPSYKARCENGAILAVDSTFLPPPLHFALRLGIDVVMHSSTKFLGGHSDLLGGVLIVPSESTAQQLRRDRTSSGSVMGSLESWLLIRSLRTLSLRVNQQSETAHLLVEWLSNDVSLKSCIHTIWHGSVQYKERLKLLGIKPSPVFSIQFTSPSYAFRICQAGVLKLFTNATSLGGVESLIEWRFAVDPSINPAIVRVSVGLEAFQDLKNDLQSGLKNISKE